MKKFCLQALWFDFSVTATAEALTEALAKDTAKEEFEYLKEAADDNQWVHDAVEQQDQRQQ